jgi:hypothetical protein
MNKNNPGPIEPIPDYAMREQADNLFILIQTVNSLSEEIKLEDIAAAGFMRHMHSELCWLRDQTCQIRDVTESFFGVHPPHPQTRSLQHIINRTATQIEVIKETYGQLALSAFRERHLLSNHRNRLQTLLYQLYLSFSRLQKQLRQLDQETQAFTGD